MLVSTETGGLGNRIKCWISAARLDPGARVYWPKTFNMPAAFGELFANDCGVDSVPDGASVRCTWRLAILPEDIAELPAGFATAGGVAHPLLGRAERWLWKLRGEPDDRFRYVIKPKRLSPRSTRRDGRLIDLEYGRIPDHFRRVYRPLFATVTPHPQIAERVEAFAARHIDASVTGVQVRTWRDSRHRQRKHFWPGRRRLEKLLEGAGDGRRFFVVSDDDDVVPWIRRTVGSDRVVSYPRETSRRASWQSSAGMTEDLIDMLLLARTGELFASYLSTFSETAWWIGGAKAKVSVF